MIVLSFCPHCTGSDHLFSWIYQRQKFRANFFSFQANSIHLRLAQTYHEVWPFVLSGQRWKDGVVPLSMKLQFRPQLGPSTGAAAVDDLANRGLITAHRRLFLNSDGGCHDEYYLKKKKKCPFIFLILNYCFLKARKLVRFQWKLGPGGKSSSYWIRIPPRVRGRTEPQSGRVLWVPRLSFSFELCDSTRFVYMVEVVNIFFFHPHIKKILGRKLNWSKIPTMLLKYQVPGGGRGWFSGSETTDLFKASEWIKNFKAYVVLIFRSISD